MLENRLFGNIRTIPNTYGCFEVTEDGIVLKKRGNILEHVTDKGMTYYRTGIDWLPEWTPISKLVLLAFKPVNIPLERIADIEVLFRDEDVTNLDPTNLIWRFPQPIPIPTASEFCFIPAFTNYGISLDGDILSTHTGELASQYVASSGYWSLRMTSDVNRSVEFHRHRCMAYTYLPYDYRVCELIPNHIDSNKLNCAVSNIEWMTRLGNNTHAIIRNQLGQFPTSPVDLLNIHTQETWAFPSITDCAKFLNIPNKNVEYAVRNGKLGSIISGKYIVKYRNSDWPDYKSRVDLHRISGLPSPVLAKNVVSGEVMRFDSAAKFVEYSGLTRKQVYPYLKDNIQKQRDIWIFKYEDSDEPWIK